MSFTFKFAIDYVKLNTMLDAFLKQHDKELTAMVGSCLTIQKEDEIVQPQIQKAQEISIIPTIQTNDDYFDRKIQAQQKKQAEADHKVDNRPMIGDNIPDDPFSNMFQGKNANANTTRIGDRNQKHDP